MSCSKIGYGLHLTMWQDRVQPGNAFRFAFPLQRLFFEIALVQEHVMSLNQQNDGWVSVAQLMRAKNSKKNEILWGFSFGLDLNCSLGPFVVSCHMSWKVSYKLFKNTCVAWRASKMSISTLSHFCGSAKRDVRPDAWKQWFCDCDVLYDSQEEASKRTNFVCARAGQASLASKTTCWNVNHPPFIKIKGGK